MLIDPSRKAEVLELLKKGAEFVFWMDADSLFISDGVDLQWACDLGKDAGLYIKIKFH